MQARCLTASLFGIGALPVTVEADVSGGLPRFTIVGLPDGAVREAAERVRAAVKRSGIEWPSGRITVNLAPADLRKGGTGLDLAIAVALLGATGAISPRRLDGGSFFGELSLSGGLRPAHGALAVARAMAERGARFLITAPECAREAALVSDLAVYAAPDLETARGLLCRPPSAWGESVRSETSGLPGALEEDGPDLADVRGQARARRAVEVAAAGGHNLLLFGPPGSGKTLLARRVPGLLPAPDLDEALEITQVASCAGLGTPTGLVVRRPFRSPHHTITAAGLIGGGGLPRPGEASLAHGGVLFLDELTEFASPVLDLLRQPLEDGEVLLSRAGRVARFPARFLLVAAMNPCHCGYLGDTVRSCSCSPHAVARYRGRISGPLLDRIDLQIEVPRVDASDLDEGMPREGSRAVRARVMAARRAQAQRYTGTQFRVNGDLDGPGVRRFCEATAAGRRFLVRAVATLGLSARAHDRILKVARTLADLEGVGLVTECQLAEGVSYRALDRRAIATA